MMASGAPRLESGAPRPTPDANSPDGRVRAVIDAVFPSVDCGRFAAKRIAGEPVEVEAHCFTDGHDALRAVLCWHLDTGADTDTGDDGADEIEMRAEPNDVWRARFTPSAPGLYRFTVVAWVDPLESWRREFARREDADDLRMAARIGARLIEATAARAARADAEPLSDWARRLEALAGPTAAAGAVAGVSGTTGPGAVPGPGAANLAGAAPASVLASLRRCALDESLFALAGRYADRSFAAHASRPLRADPPRAGFSAWYEMFPRSAAAEPGRHGSFRDVALRLPYVAELGFDVLYFPPIHPIGRANRKGPNNALAAAPGDVGSPWAIGAAEGGHKDILPELGTLEDFRALLASARGLGLDIALDLAFQTAPDHPYTSSHPDWFKHRPDGSVQYAENPPKRYQDIYPFDFESEDWRGLWIELKSVIDFWIDQGVWIFRVDNPHTKAFPFWEWVIDAVKRAHPDVLFLAEAFTRPKVMRRLAKLGFSQSYTYFTWRNSKSELTEYFSELAHGESSEYLRPNLWPNTPDILHEMLQSGLRAVYAARLVLAATLSANYGIYGPAFELMESTPREPGSEEYQDSEKYQLRHWNLDRPDSLRSLIARLNHIRRDNRALQSDRSLRFCRIDNEQLIAYLKSDRDSGNVIVSVVNLDPHNSQSGWLELEDVLPPDGADRPYQAHDLLSDQRFRWQGTRNFVQLDPGRAAAQVLRIRRHLRSEHDFDYFL
jgi:starch synthase (maltosyl-transferring)